MKVIRAKSAGFCWGVERAIDIAREYAQKGRHPVYTDGPLIHNRQMMEVLTGEGIREVGDYRSEAKLEVSKSTDAGAVMVVRAHGISPETQAIVMEALCGIDAMLDGLGSKVRRAFLMSQLEGMAYADIASALGVSVSSVKKYMAKATEHCLIHALEHEL